MAKVTMPLHSLNAVGTVAGLLTFTGRLGRNVARQLNTEPHNRSANQVREQERLLDGAAVWNELDAPTRARWLAAAAIAELPPFAYFYNAIRKQNTPPGEAPLPPATS